MFINGITKYNLSWEKNARHWLLAKELASWETKVARMLIVSRSWRHWFWRVHDYPKRGTTFLPSKLKKFVQVFKVGKYYNQQLIWIMKDFHNLSDNINETCYKWHRSLLTKCAIKIKELLMKFDNPKRTTVLTSQVTP